jgi:hypothetical protein
MASNVTAAASHPDHRIEPLGPAAVRHALALCRPRFLIGSRDASVAQPLKGPGKFGVHQVTVSPCREHGQLADNESLPTRDWARRSSPD